MKFSKKTLNNGLRIITIPMKRNPSVTCLVMVEAGSKYEVKEKNGLSHFLEHMCFKGTKRRPKAADISRELDSIGAEYNAFTGQEYTGYYAKAHPKHISKILEVISDMYLNPIFDEQEIEKEKGVIVEEINMYEDMPQRHVHDLWSELLYGDQPAGWNIAGPREVVKAMKREDFVKYRGEHYVAKGTMITIAGDFAEAKILKEMEKLFTQVSVAKKYDKKKVVERQSTPQILVKFKETDQAHLILGVRSYPILDKRTITLGVLNTVLSGGMSSRLFQKLRDKMGVCYYVRSENNPYTDHGNLAVSTGVDTKRVPEVLAAILNEFFRLKNQLVPVDELTKAKDYFIDRKSVV